MAKSKYTPERVARLVKNPGTRSTVPTRYLPAQYRQQRELNARLAAPVTPGSSYTNRDAARERNATVDQKYGAAERQSQAQAAAIPQWYDQYRQLLSAAQQGVQQGYAAATQQMQALQTGTAAQQAQPQTAALNQQIAALGGNPDPAAAQVGAQAAGQRAAMAGNIGSVLAAQGANANAYGAQQYANSGKSQLEALQHELDQQQELKTQKGSYAAQTDASIKDRERKAVLENQAFGLDVAKANQSAAEAATDDARADRQARSQREQQQGAVNKYGYSDKDWRAMSTAERQRIIKEFNASGGSSGSGGGGSGSQQGVKPATPTQRNSANSQIQQALTYARAAAKKKTPRSKIAAALVAGTTSRTKVDEKKYQQLVDKGVKPVDARRQASSRTTAIPRTDQLWASVALDIAYDGHLSRNNQRKLQSLGYSVRDLGLPSYGQRVRTTPPRVSSAPGSNGQRRPT